MINMKSIISFCLVLSLGLTLGYGKENIGMTNKKSTGMRTTAACSPSSSSVELDVNNVRCLLHNGGDFWWDLQSNPRYEVPKVENPADKRHSSFAGSLWIGGIDEGGQLRVAAQTYRQSGNDFWAGPLTQGGASIDDVTCEKWDRHYKITKAEISAFLTAYNLSQTIGTTVDLANHAAVRDWPTQGEDMDGNSVYLAPFVDVNCDGFYDPSSGDYPDLRPTCVSNSCTGEGGFPDQAIWWVINDKGDVHTETGAVPIGLEIQMLAFAFTTANAVNDMTFYKYKVFNRSSLTINDCYMGQWVDADVGLYSDDYVGCNIDLGLGFAYNGDVEDEGASGYGLYPPTLGVDFFQGPVADPGDGLDNDHDGTIDEPGELIGMSKFVYYENDFSLRGNPEVATHYYGYLRGFWKDGSRMVDNGRNGFPSTAPGPITDFMYPGDGGWCPGSPQTGWSEISAGNQPFDRRFLESAGPFTLQPGAVNEIVTGAVWARGYYNDNKGSVCELLKADEVAQALFDACFELLDGPDAPEITINEYDQELLITWGYSEATRGIRNNYNESYEQADPVLKANNIADSTFKFQGYLIYQLKDASVTANELRDTEKARLIAQCDIKDGISTIVNRTVQLVTGLPNPVIMDEIMVSGADDGLINSIRMTEDLFAPGGADRRLRNYTTYYYTVISYAYNDTSSDGKQFIIGNRFFSNTPAVPHKVDFENYGTQLNAAYGDGMEITQTAGIGNGYRNTRFTTTTEADILKFNSSASLTFERGFAPIVVKVVDPKLVGAWDYRLEVLEDRFAGKADTISGGVPANVVIDSTFLEWVLMGDDGTGMDTIYKMEYKKRYKGNTVISTTPIPLDGKERVIGGHGISISVTNGFAAGDTNAPADPIISQELEFGDLSQMWLAGLEDTEDDFDTWNWILAGTDASDRKTNAIKAAGLWDRDENFEDLIEGTWAPFALARGYNGSSGIIGPGLQVKTPGTNIQNVSPDSVVKLTNLPDVDIVFTSDSSKWSRCVVVETTPTMTLGGGSWPMTAKWRLPVDKSGNPTSATLTIANQGFSWFPGYAINVTTGERLNIFFGESSWDKQNNGDDMKFNPTSSNGAQLDRVGGRHYVWVHNSAYDGCAKIQPMLACELGEPVGGVSFAQSRLINVPSTGVPNDLQLVYNHVSWVGIPMLSSAFEFNKPQDIPTEARVRLRISRVWSSRPGTSDHPVFTFSTDEFSAQTQVEGIAIESLMEQIRVVPNPYYAFSDYESSQIQTKVKITNLPQKCTIKIFTLNGTLIRTYKKESDEPDQEWDLKNSTGVPIASGVYILHIDAGDLGEKVVKFFGIMPEIDLNAF